MAFDWRSFLDHRRLDYVTQGPNVGAGELGLNCPLCLDDAGHHLGINLTSGFWSCWRNSQHRGRRPHRLVMALLRCSYEEAARIVGSDRPPLDTFDAVIGNLRVRRDDRTRVDSAPALRMPDSIRPITGSRLFTRALDYLHGRGFRDPLALASIYHLHFGLDGRWRDRVVIPIHLDVGRGVELVSWTARTIRDDVDLRYLALPTDPERARKLRTSPALAVIKDTVLWHPRLLRTGGQLLLVVEGPFDALKLDYYGRHRGLRATCLHGMAVSLAQVALLGDLAPRFARGLAVMTDREQWASGLRMAMQPLGHLGVRHLPTPAGRKDPGDLSEHEVANIVI